MPHSETVIPRWALAATRMVVGLLVVCGLSACLRDQYSTSIPVTATQAVAAPATSSPAPAGPITLTFWEDDSNEAAVVLDALVAEFMRINPEIQITRQHYGYDELRNQFRAAAFSGRAPAVVRAPGEFAGPFGELGIVRPLDEVFSAEYLGQFLPGALGGAATWGKLWGLPDNFGNHLMLLYNRELVNEVPSSTDDWVAQLRLLTDAADGRYGLVYPLTESYWLVPWLTGFGSWPLDAQGHVALDTAEMVEALWFAHDLRYLYQVMPENSSYGTAFEMFGQGQAAYIIDGAWNLDRYQGLGVDVGVAALPRISKTGLAAAPMATGRYWFISEASSGVELDAAARFIEFMTSAETQQRWLADLQRLPSLKNAELILNAMDSVARDQPQDPADATQGIASSLLAGMITQLRVARGVPPALEMACVWQGMDAYLPAIMTGQLSPDDAPPQMQAEAEACVAEMGGYLTPTP